MIISFLFVDNNDNDNNNTEREVVFPSPNFHKKNYLTYPFSLSAQIFTM